MQHGANINSLDKNGETALSKAVVGYPFRDELPGGDGHLAGEYWDGEPDLRMVAKLVESGADLLSKLPFYKKNCGIILYQVFS